MMYTMQYAAGGRVHYKNTEHYSTDCSDIIVLLSYNFYVDSKEKQFDCDSSHASQEKCHAAPAIRCQASGP